MTKINVAQNVVLFPDDDMIGIQEVCIQSDDPCGPWVNVLHSGAEISLSLDNWNKLVELVEEAKTKLSDAV